LNTEGLGEWTDPDYLVAYSDLEQLMALQTANISMNMLKMRPDLAVLYELAPAVPGFCTVRIPLNPVLRKMYNEGNLTLQLVKLNKKKAGKRTRVRG
jgi:hypothetical protein